MRVRFFGYTIVDFLVADRPVAGRFAYSGNVTIPYIGAV